MGAGSGIPAVVLSNYVLPASAHQALTQPATTCSPNWPSRRTWTPDLLSISAEALAVCFDRLADDLERIADAARPSAE
ncbi:hypothetical protein V1318_12725 [Lysobacter sp. CCNWLW3]|uniref:hypothetical protein n=1 Tax=unclassified Lysobacter TaxID=2635362 RepID=UPI002FD10F93